jgi:aromatic ring-cleaving dioxygenase
MAMQPVSKIAGYHAHIYYDPEKTKDRAAAIREAIAERFEGAEIGSWHDELVGPHTASNYLVSFEVGLYPEIVPWLALNRNGLSVLIHPRTGASAPDHTDHAIWMGEQLAVNLAGSDGRHRGQFGVD